MRFISFLASGIPIIESLYRQHEANLTAGTVDLLPAVQQRQPKPSKRQGNIRHRGKAACVLARELRLVRAGRMGLAVPARRIRQHQYWNYSGRVASFAFMVVPNYA